MEAIHSGLPCLLIYLFEPSLMCAPQSSARHWRFVYESIEDINTQLKPYQGRLYYWVEEAIDLFEKLSNRFEVNAVYSHQETGLNITYQRDLSIKTLFEKKVSLGLSIKVMG